MATGRSRNGEMPPTTEWGRLALAVRGYNQTNLGRTPDLLAVPAYRPVLTKWLRNASSVCAEVTGKKVDLLPRVASRREAGIDEYPETVAMVMGVEFAQLELLSDVHGFELSSAHVAFGYSLGELVAVAAAGLQEPDNAMRVPLSLAADCASLADDCTMAIVFSRREPIAESDLELLCLELSAAGRGTIGISAVLSPNTYLVVGQGDTVDRLEQDARSQLGVRVSVRRNPDTWPPLHTPIVRQRNVPDRAATMMASIPLLGDRPAPKIFSLTSGGDDYDPLTVRTILRNWSDHPQRLWAAIEYVLESNVETVVHVGPEPNVIPATFSRLADNVAQQLAGASLRSYGAWAIANLARRLWLANLLPRETALLRAPLVKHVILEEWLFEHAPGSEPGARSASSKTFQGNAEP